MLYVYGLIALLFCIPAQAKLITFKNHSHYYVYNTNSVKQDKNITEVIVITTDPSLNVTHAKNYAGAAIGVMFRCDKPLFVIPRIILVDKKGKLITQLKPKDMKAYAIQPDTVPYYLEQHLCKKDWV